MQKHLEHDEESLKEKAKRGAGIFTLIGTGILSIVHTLSHVIPAIGALGFVLGSRYEPLYKIVSNEYMQLAFIPFVFLSFWYIYRDHKHHKHEHELRRKLGEAEREIQRLRKKR